MDATSGDGNVAGSVGEFQAYHGIGGNWQSYGRRAAADEEGSVLSIDGSCQFVMHVSVD